MKYFWFTFLAIVLVVVGVGVAHGITYKDNLKEKWDNTFNKTEQKTETNSINDYEGFKNNERIKDANIIDAKSFNNLSNAIKEEYLKTNHDISFVMEIKND